MEIIENLNSDENKREEFLLSLKSMAFQELKILANEYKTKDEFENALPYFQEMYSREASSWNGFFLAQCFRKTSKYFEAREIHNILKTNFPLFMPIKNEELWLDYSEKIKDWDNSELIEDAEDLISRTDLNNPYSIAVYNKTILSVVKRLIYDKENEIAITWLDKLDFTKLSNKPFSYRGQKFPSEQKTFFIHYADALIKLNMHINYISRCLSCLRIEDEKQKQFLKYIEESITFNYRDGQIISRMRYGLYLKYFRDEIYNRKSDNYEDIYNPDKITLISDLGDFEFCPASFSINETYKVESNSSWEKDEWLGEKKLLFDRYSDFKRSNDFIKSFEDSEINVDENVINDFNDIFKSKIFHYHDTNSIFFKNSDDTLRGNPDYIFEMETGEKFVVVEKFTKSNSEKTAIPYSNDSIKLLGYLYELESLNLEFGYLIYWYWDIFDISDNPEKPKKKIKVRNYHIFKFEKTDDHRKKLKISIDRITLFKQTKNLFIDGNKISYPNKCLNCSAVSYCNHKTGTINQINLPYDISSLILKEEPKINFASH